MDREKVREAVDIGRVEQRRLNDYEDDLNAEIKSILKNTVLLPLIELAEQYLAGKIGELEKEYPCVNCNKLCTKEDIGIICAECWGKVPSQFVPATVDGIKNIIRESITCRYFADCSVCNIGGCDKEKMLDNAEAEIKKLKQFVPTTIDKILVIINKNSPAYARWDNDKQNYVPVTQSDLLALAEALVGKIGSEKR